MNVVKKIKGLCSPAFIYFTMSMLLTFITIVNAIRTKKFKKFNALLITLIVIKIVYVVFWTWVLNLICKSGHQNISWMLVLFPFIIMFLLMLTIKIKK